MRSWPIHLAVPLALALLCAGSGAAWALQQGDILVADSERGLLWVDATTGAQHELTGIYNGHGFYDVVNDAAGDIFAIAVGGVVVRADNGTGAVSVVSLGGYLLYPSAIDRGPSGALYVLEGGSPNRIVRVDPANGQQTVMRSGFIGSGLAVASDTIAYVMTASGVSSWYLTRYDLVSGDSTRVSDTVFYNPGALELEGDGKVLVSRTSLADVWRVDPATGAAAPVTSGGLLMTPLGLATEANGTILLGDNQNLLTCTRPNDRQCPGALYRVDPVSGAQTLVTEKGLFYDIHGITRYLGPTTTAAERSSWGSVKIRYR